MIRIATGCYTMATVDAVHEEAQELPVLPHVKLLRGQCALDCLQLEHTCHKLLLRKPMPRRHMKATFAHVNKHVQSLLPSDHTPS